MKSDKKPNMFQEACAVVYEAFVSKERQKLRNALKFWCAPNGCIQGSRMKRDITPAIDYKAPTFEDTEPASQIVWPTQLMVINNTVRVPKA